MTTTARPVAELLAIYDAWLHRLYLPDLIEWQTGVLDRMDMTYNIPTGVESMSPAAFCELVAECAEDLTRHPYEHLYLPTAAAGVSRILEFNPIFAHDAYLECDYSPEDVLDEDHERGLTADAAVIKAAKNQLNKILEALPDLEDLLTLPVHVVQ